MTDDKWEHVGHTAAQGTFETTATRKSVTKDDEAMRSTWVGGYVDAETKGELEQEWDAWIVDHDRAIRAEVVAAIYDRASGRSVIEVIAWARDLYGIPR